MSPTIHVEGLTKRYRAVTALEGLGFAVPAGRITGFLGPNGAGKTTTFRAILGLTGPDAGSIEVLGEPMPGGLRRVARRIGAIIEEPGLIRGLSGRVNMRVAADTLGAGHDRIEGLLEFVDLTADADRRVEDYSKGMRQRLALAAALIGEPELLLLDEPLDGLDPAGQHAFKARLRALAEEGRTVVVSSHDLADIEQLADHVVIIDRGRLVYQGPLADLVSGSTLRVVVSDPVQARAVLAAAGIDSEDDDGFLRVHHQDGSEVARALAGAAIYPMELAPLRSSLETVFLRITAG